MNSLSRRSKYQLCNLLTGCPHSPIHGRPMENYGFRPKDLNAAIHHNHYHTPTLDEITHELGGSMHFTKLDGTSSCLCVILDYESSILMMFNTPWGCYRFVHLPWGLACTQDIFQQMMDQILECCEGVTGIADDASSGDMIMKSTINACTHSCRLQENIGLSSMARNVS